MMRREGILTYKWRDAGYMRCPKCGRLLLRCPMCHQDMLMPKAEQKPDFLVAMEYVYVEAKGGGLRWDFEKSITPTQRIVMREHEGWLFLEMGEGRAPKGRAAYLVPWQKWTIIEEQLLSQDVHSVIWERSLRSKNPSADELMGEYRVVWDDGDWKIPEEHPFRQAHRRFFSGRDHGNFDTAFDGDPAAD